MYKWFSGLGSKMTAIWAAIAVGLAFLAKLKWTQHKRDQAEDERDQAVAGRDQAQSNEAIARDTRRERDDEENQAQVDIAKGKVPNSLGGGINEWD